MDSRELKLWQLLQKAGKGGELSESDREFAQSCLGAADSQMQANACEILIRYGKPGPAWRHALRKVEKLCEKTSDENYVITLLITMLCFPPSCLLRKKFAGFAKTCARSNRWEIRTNAVCVLQQLARGGDRNALRLVTLLTDDANDFVRANARNALQALTKT